MENFNNNTNNQNGRSMIEMLGVLAIIGVLSVGGIAGYSKAMHKYRVNKAIEEITMVASNIRSFFGTKKVDGFSFGSDDYTVIKKAKLIPEDMWNDSNNRYEHPWGYRFHLDDGVGKFGIQLEGVPLDACIDLFSYDWSTAGVKSYDADGPDLIPPIDINEAVEACTTASDMYGDALQLSFCFE